MKPSDKDSKKIIVPWDFSDVSYYALEHAERNCTFVGQTN